MYDTKAQRRPVIDFEVGEKRLTSLIFTHNENEALVGNVVGEVMLLDLRRQKTIRRFKGIGGSVRCITMHPKRDLFAAASLDRWLSFYETNSSETLERLYLKQQLTCAIFSKALPKKKKKKDAKATGNKGTNESPKKKKRRQKM